MAWLKKIVVLFVAGGITASSAFAEGSLEVVKSNTTAANFILFNLVSRSREESSAAARKYKSSILQDPELKDFVPLAELGASLGKFEGRIDRPQVLLLANASKSTMERTRYENAFIQPFSKMGADVYILPVAATIGLSRAEKREFFDLISQKFDLMISNGGDDVAPALYGEAVTYSVDINERRDHFESEVIRSYIDRGRGFFLGVCRGMQLTAVSYGMKMYQDISKELGPEVEHGGESFRFHRVQLPPTKSSLLKSFVGGAAEILGFSWHHQAVKFLPNGLFQIAGLVRGSEFPEALESVNGKVLLTQFHPEYFNRIDAQGQHDQEAWGEKILRGIFGRAKTSVVRVCNGVFL